MQYALLLVSEESLDPQPGTPEFDVDMEGYGRFDEIAGEAILGGEALQPVSTATTIRADGPEPIVSAGPFIESTEVVGGVFIVETEDLDAAIELAREIPVATYGAVEVRPINRFLPSTATGGPGTETDPRLTVLIWHPGLMVPSQQVIDETMEAHARFQADHAAVMAGGIGLAPASSATTVRVRDGEVLLSDGPYTETTEVIGGLYLLGSIPNESVADVVAQIPHPPGGGLELRPIWEVG